MTEEGNPGRVTAEEAAEDAAQERPAAPEDTAGRAPSEGAGDGGEARPAPEAGDGEDAARAALELEAKLFTARRRIADLEAQLLRLRADFDNYRKRTRRELAEEETKGRARVMSALLPVLDNLERAREAVTQAAARADAGESQLKTVADGVDMVFRQLWETLTAEGLAPVEAVGRPFDPYLHESVATVRRPGIPEGEIVEEVRRGWRLADRLLRPAQVVVAGPGEEAGATEDESDIPQPHGAADGNEEGQHEQDHRD